MSQKSSVLQAAKSVSQALTPDTERGRSPAWQLLEANRVEEYPMDADFERLLEPGCTELRACRCGKEMRITRTYSSPEGTETHVRVYSCPVCHHELWLTVWGAEQMI